ncbi:MAG: bifunctional UDP-N-acetylglucosamine diphosphorylase/glucosamine-1-phosphate N-acetyltransferase GlmU [Gammaproteobacteria bacterium]|nr:bifunctional UDP-N-acetylglucosamine diphosphorylase/glucosamine-1-phosphate N-acetyltransferase GlmU [Gammaproteobacteria bacterium]
MTSPLEIIILAAGKGTRMYSDTPKVLHQVAGVPLLGHVIRLARQLEPSNIHVIYGHGGQKVPDTIAEPGLNWVEQAEQLGTGHAVSQAMPAVNPGSTVLVLYGDVPLTRPETLRNLVATAGDEVAVLTAILDDASGYGRIIRNARGDVLAIVEQKDLSEDQQKIREINSGYIVAPAEKMNDWLAALRNDNAAGEYYLTDIIAMAISNGVSVAGVVTEDNDEIMGINNKQQLAYLERVYQHRVADDLMSRGVTLRDRSRVDVRGTLTTGRDVEIDVNVVFEGDVRLGDRVQIGPNCVLKDVEIAEGTTVFASSVLDQAVIGKNCRIGPFARIRPEANIADDAHIGNFVEVKKSTIGKGSKVNHLAYIGDTRMGSGVNIGAGTITCNYDGANKHMTVIGDNAFIGSDTQLVAPVTVGDNATIGAGSTITADTPPDQLTLTRIKQKSIAGWKRPVKNKPAKD